VFVVDDPLIAGMTIQRILPLHESSRRLCQLTPETPRVYSVAVMTDVSRRRWWPLVSTLTGDRLQRMQEAGARDMTSPAAAAQQLAATLAHVVIGRLVALLALEGRAWDAGPENLWVHTDSDGAIDWVGVVDPTLRILPDDPQAGSGDVVRVPGEAALAMWTAHRCHRTLAPLFATLHDVSGGALAVSRMWHSVGLAVVVTASQAPLLGGTSRRIGVRRGQAVLDAMTGFGLEVRGPGSTPQRRGKSCVIRTALPIV
jgi:hypothetical protein